MTHPTKPSEARTVCLIATLNPDRGLSIALRQHLVEVVPEIQFTLDPLPAGVDSVWVCGYEEGREGIVRSLRMCHPSAVIVVTGREPVEGWEPEVARAGADFAFTWPVAYDVLRSGLRGTLPEGKSLRAERTAFHG
jgi:hypothetical protein